MTQMNFAQYIGMSPASLSSIFNDRTKPTLNTVEAIKSKIPRINTEWLIFGTGGMYVEDSVSPDSDNSDIDIQAPDEPILDFGNDATNIASSQQPSQNISNKSINASQKIIRNEIKYIDKPQRQITEIRVYFDDLTYETFEPKK